MIRALEGTSARDALGSGDRGAAATAVEQKRIKRFNRLSLTILAGVVLVSHGLYLLNQGAFWDGVAYLHAIETGRYPELKEHFWRAGSPLSYYFHRFAGLFPAPVLAYRVMYLGSEILTSYFLYRLLSRLPVPRLIALTASVFSVLMPFSLVSFDLSLTIVHLCLMCFLIGTEWRLLAAQSENRTASISRQAAALVLLAVSFVYGTCLLVAMAAAAASAAPLFGPKRWRHAAVGRLRTWPDVHLLPFACAAAKQMFLSPFGRYEHYNKLVPPSGEQIETWLRIPATYLQRLYEAISATRPGLGDFELRAIILASAAIGIVGFFSWTGRLLHAPLAEADRWPWRSRLVAVGTGLVLVYLTIAPHFLVGRENVYFTGYISRDNMAVSLPVGALLAMVVFAVLPRLSRVSLIVVVALAVRLMAFQADLARKWLDEDLKLKMIVALLPDVPEVRAAEIVVYEDFATRFFHLEWLEFQYVLSRAFGDERRIAFNTFELARSPSLEACVEAFTPKREEPYDALAGARDARGCGLAVKARILSVGTTPFSWSDYSMGYTGGEPLRALARTRMKVVGTLLKTLPCPGS